MTERLPNFRQRQRAEANSGLDAGRFLWALIRSRGVHRDLEDLVEQTFGETAPRVSQVTKAAVDAISTTSAGFADALSWRGVVQEVLAVVSARSVLGRLSPRMRHVSFNVPTLVETAPATSQWVGQRLAKPLSTFSLESATLPVAKIVTLVPFTAESVRTYSDTTARSIVDAVVAGLTKFADHALLDPSVAAVAGTNPASLTNGAPTVPSSGSTAAQISSDLRTALGVAIANGSDLSNVVIVVHPTTALYLSQVLTTGGDLAFPDMGATGGTIWKLPVLTSLGVERSGVSPTERVIAVIDPARVLLADDGGVTVDASREASMQMVTNPSNGAATMVSLWQFNLECLKAERLVNWQAADDAAVQVISGVTY